MPSEAVLYRTIAKRMPTLLLDETDAIFDMRTADRYEGLRALINAGHRRGATVSRATNFGQDLEQFQVFSPKVLAGIGVLPETITDRSVPIRLQRKTRAEKVSRFFRRTAAAEAAPLAVSMMDWANLNGAAVGAARPVMPEQLSDRMQEGCEPLIAIADALGCGDEARAGLVVLFSGVREDEKESAGLALLADVREVFLSENTDRLPAQVLANLVASNGNGWGNWMGRGFTTRDLTTMIRAYGVEPKSVRTSEGVAKGYKWDELQPAFERYLPERNSEDALDVV